MKARHEFSSREEYRDYLKVYISALAMQGLLTNRTDYSYKSNVAGIPIEAVEYTDELLKALNL